VKGQETTMKRLTSSIPTSTLVKAQITKVQQHYRGALSEHRVLASSTLIGLGLLADEPKRLAELTSKEINGIKALRKGAAK
jgi:hypothetical protein